jgi:hypothetical protein
LLADSGIYEWAPLTSLPSAAAARDSKRIVKLVQFGKGSSSTTPYEPLYSQARNCEVLVVLRGFDGTATVELRWDGDRKRRILFVKGEPKAADVAQTMSFTRNERGWRVSFNVAVTLRRSPRLRSLPVQGRAQRVGGEERFPAAGREFVDTFRGMLSDTLQDIDKIVVRVDAVQSAGDDQSLQGADMPGTEFGPSRTLWIVGFRLRRDKPRPARPMPTSASGIGSGADVGVGTEAFR